MPEAFVQLDHVALGVPAVAGVVPLIVGALGGRPRDAGPGRGFCFWQWEFEGGGALEVLEPAGPADGFLHRFLAQRGPGLHHATFKVPDIHVALDHAKALGFHVVGFDARQPSWIEAFLHPKSTPGLVVQIVESHPPAGGSQGPELAFPPAPEPARPPARLLGLHMRVQDERRARTLFEDLLCGNAQMLEGRLVFRWQGSPLRIAVTLDAERPEGPRELEIAAAQRVEIPAGAQALIGVEIVQREQRG